MLKLAGRVGHGRHGGEAPALRGGPMMSALTFCPFLLTGKDKKNGDEIADQVRDDGKGVGVVNRVDECLLRALFIGSVLLYLKSM